MASPPDSATATSPLVLKPARTAARSRISTSVKGAPPGRRRGYWNRTIQRTPAPVTRMKSPPEIHAGIEIARPVLIALPVRLGDRRGIDTDVGHHRRTLSRWKPRTLGRESIAPARNRPAGFGDTHPIEQVQRGIDRQLEAADIDGVRAISRYRGPTNRAARTLHGHGANRAISDLEHSGCGWRRRKGPPDRQSTAIVHIETRLARLAGLETRAIHRRRLERKRVSALQCDLAFETGGLRSRDADGDRLVDFEGAVGSHRDRDVETGHRQRRWRGAGGRDTAAATHIRTPVTGGRDLSGTVRLSSCSSPLPHAAA